MSTLSIQAQISELLHAGQRRFDAHARTLKTHPLSGKPLRKRDLVEPFPVGATERKLNAFEHRTGVSLPASMREWLKISNGASGFYGVRPTNPNRDLERIWESFTDFRAQAWIPAGDDGFGNFYIQLPCETVCFVETIHSTEEPAYVVASDMLHFVLFKLQDELGLHPGLAKSMGLKRVPRSPWPFSKTYMMRRDPALKAVRDLLVAWK